MAKYVFLFVVLLTAACSLSVLAQDADNGKVTISVQTSSDTLAAGDKIGFAVKLNIENGWHINSNQPGEDFLIPTLLSVTSQAKIDTANIVYPVSAKIKTGFSDAPLSVFLDESVITGVITAADNDSAEITVNFELQYQACNNQTCSAPETARCKKTFAFIKK
jgi:thioredoxin:protein disulfide reductase